MRSSRERGTTLMELMLVAAIISTLGIGLSQAGIACVKWGWAAGDVVRQATAEERLRRMVGEVAAVARPVRGLSIGPMGELAEHELEGSVASWGLHEEALVFRSSSAYWVFATVDRARLVRRRIGFDGRVGAPEIVVEGTDEVTFVLCPGHASPGDREPGIVGLTYALRVKGQKEPVSGFVALRVEQETGKPPAAPTPAVRWKGGAR